MCLKKSLQHYYLKLHSRFLHLKFIWPTNNAFLFQTQFNIKVESENFSNYTFQNDTWQKYLWLRTIFMIGKKFEKRFNIMFRFINFPKICKKTERPSCFYLLLQKIICYTKTFFVSTFIFYHLLQKWYVTPKTFCVSTFLI